MDNLSPAVRKALITDLASKVGLRVLFVADYLEATGQGVRALSRAVVGHGAAGTLRDLSAMIVAGDKLGEC